MRTEDETRMEAPVKSKILERAETMGDGLAHPENLLFQVVES